MDAVKTRLVQKSQPRTSRDLSGHVLATVKRDVFVGEARAISEGQIALASPDTFEQDGKESRLLFSTLLDKHVWLREVDVRLL